MDKLNKRQMIVLSITALSILYAAYVYLIAPPTSNKVITNESAQEINTLLSGFNNDLIKDTQAGMDAYIIARAEADWQKNPFWDKSSFKEWAVIQAGAGDSGSKVKINYSGYVDAGKIKIAIINGLEYRVGEQLEIEGYVLKRITPSKVSIVNRNTGSEVEIPIQE
ncbi:MAG: hypothetical protein WCO53_14405 [Deltaproteobacteria bacterium]